MSSSNALGWVFPGGGLDRPSTFTEVDFGPVHYKDTMVVEFTPASYTGEIRLYCDYQNAAQGNVWTLVNTGSPLTYNFNQKTPNPNDPNDYHVCHFFFAANTVSTSSGNTLAFQYMNNSTSKAITWSSKGSFGTPTIVGTTTTLPITTTSIDDTATTLITTTSVKPTAETTSEILTTTTTSPVQSPTIAGSSSTNITAVSQSSGLSGGPIAGIVIAILALIGIIAGLGFFFGKRARRNRSDGPSLLPAGDESNTQAMYKSENQGQSSMEQVPAWAGKQNGQQVRMGELYAGEQVRMGELHGGGRPIASELDPRGVVYELDHGHRNELP